MVACLSQSWNCLSLFSFSYKTTICILCFHWWRELLQGAITIFPLVCLACTIRRWWWWGSTHLAFFLAVAYITTIFWWYCKNLQKYGDSDDDKTVRELEQLKLFHSVKCHIAHFFWTRARYFSLCNNNEKCCRPGAAYINSWAFSLENCEPPTFIIGCLHGENEIFWGSVSQYISGWKLKFFNPLTKLCPWTKKWDQTKDTCKQTWRLKWKKKC